MTQNNPREGRTWPGYILGGRLRTSTLVLIVAFVAIGWLYETYEPKSEAPTQVPASEVVPPGFIPDPNYTWAPRTDVQRHTPTTTESAPTTTPSSGTETPTTTPTTPTTPTSGAPTPTTSGPSTAPVTPTSATQQPVATTTPASASVLPSPSLPPLTHPSAPLPPAPTS